MQVGPAIAPIAALIGDPARANMLEALMDGRALTATELAQISNITPQTVSGHLAKLEQAGLINFIKQGRHRYVRLSEPDVGDVLEALMGLAERTGVKRVRAGPRDIALRQARICYDHLAGEQAVRFFESLGERGFLCSDPVPALTAAGADYFLSLGLDVGSLSEKRRPVCRGCLDWSERRFHLGGALGAGLLTHLIAKDWVRRGPGRVMTFTSGGDMAWAKMLGKRESP